MARPDRLGDVILSTPTFEVIKKNYPHAHLAVLVRQSVAPVIRGNPYVDEVISYDPDGHHAGFRGFLRLWGQIRRRRFRMAIVLQSTRRVAWAVFWSFIRYRVGPVSKIHSFFVYNRGLRQRRSHVEMHEADYNLQLLRRIGIRVGSRQVPTHAAVPADAREWAQGWLRSKGWDPTSSEPIIIVHPGMGGSALNWPETHYVHLIRALAFEKRRVLVTGGVLEGKILDGIRSQLGEYATRVLFYGGPEAGPVDYLAALMECATVIVAPSTGPLHLGVALGKKVVTFFSPIRVQSAVRWGPYLPDEARAKILVPENYCGEDFKCRGKECNYFPCMKSITVPEALEGIHKHLVKTV